jgi:uncharacterized protein (TIGR04255 family)
MPIPESPRVLYKKNPLEEVVCQFRFPTILRIETDVPSSFQEALRFEYPIYSRRVTQQYILPNAISESVQAPVPAIVISTNHEFASEDGNWIVTLNKDFLALTARRYERWEEFEEKLSQALAALIKDYVPTSFVRVGLRYKDVIDRTLLGLDGVRWSELLNPPIAGELGSPVFKEEEIAMSVRQLVIDLGWQSAKVQIRHGLGTSDTSRRASREEICYVVDSDFYIGGKTEVNDGKEKLRRLNRQAGHFFRWCITSRLHDAMEPQPID